MKIATPVKEKGIVIGLDDFAIDHFGSCAYVATEMGNSVQRIDLHTGSVEVFAGDLNSTAIAQPTAATFGRTCKDYDVLYVVTAGGLAYPIYTTNGVKQLGAQVVAVDTRMECGESPRN